MKFIQLTRGLVAIVDDADYECVSRRKWHAHSRGYACSSVSNTDGTHGTILLHRFVLGLSGRTEIDHVNRNKLDCRRSNLRICSRSQNLHNTKRRSDSSNAYRGVSFSKEKRKWVAYIDVGGKRIRLGYFDSAEEAARKRDDVARKTVGEFATLNF